MAKQTIGEILSALRTSNGMTIEEAAIRTKISAKKIAAWENNKKCPDLVSIVKLTDVYGVSPDYVFNRIQPDDKNTNVKKKRVSVASSFSQKELDLSLVKYKKQRYVMLIFSFLSAVLLFFAMLDLHDTGLILLCVALGAIIIILSLNSIFRKIALKKVGIINDVGLTEVQIEYKFEVMNTRYRCLMIDGIVYLCLGVLMFFVMYVYENDYNGSTAINAFYSVVSSVSIAFGLFTLVAARLNTQK